MKGRNSQLAEEILGIYRSGTIDSRTRRVRLLGRKCEPVILKTFLGYELQMSRTRLNCPDLATARYLKVFAEIGCTEIEIPYDPTVTAEIIPRLEELAAGLKETCPDSSQLRSVYRSLRRKLQSQ
jgi:hypothetical protein